MKRKTINSIINNKFDAWIGTITDEAVKKLVGKNTICTGGCIASMLQNEPVNDFDFYFKDKETTLAVAKYYVEVFKKNHPKLQHKEGEKDIEFYVKEDGDRVTVMVKSSGIVGEDTENNYQYFEGVNPNSGEAQDYVEKALEAAHDIATDQAAKPLYRPVFFSENAITLAGGIQLVLRFYGDPEAIHENYDFVHCTNYWISWERKTELKIEALEALITKELRYVGSKYPICSLMRVRKFLQRDPGEKKSPWTINAGNILKICLQISTLDLTNPMVLKDQLTGVDVAYFREIIEKLTEKNPDKIDTAYLVEIIDRMF